MGSMKAIMTTAVVAVSAGGTGSAQAMSWSSPFRISHGAVSSVSCQSSAFCVATSGGKVLTSSNPVERGSRWTAREVEPPVPPIYPASPRTSVSAVSCPSHSLCVAVDIAGRVVVSRRPGGDARAWKRSKLPSAGYFTAVSCPTASLCAAVDSSGNVATSTNPSGGSTAWRVSHIDDTMVPCDAGAGNPQFCQAALGGVSCPTTRLCVATDDAGDIVTSSDPAGGAQAWTVTNLSRSTPNPPPVGSYDPISCPSASLCVAVDDVHGGILTSTDPTARASAWHLTKLNDHSLDAISCASVEFCAVAGGTGTVFEATRPADGRRAWRKERIEHPGRGRHTILSGVSCPSTSLCLAVDHRGRLVVGRATGSSTG